MNHGSEYGLDEFGGWFLVDINNEPVVRRPGDLFVDPDVVYVRCDGIAND